MDEPHQHEPVVATLLEMDDSPEPVIDAAPEPAVYGAPIPVHLAVDPIPASIPVATSISLEQRIEMLERSIQNTQHLEERIAARVMDQLPESVRPTWYRRLNPFRGTSIPMPSGWLVFDLLNELRFAAAMIFDRRYAMNWASRGIIVASLAVAFTTSIWLSPFTLLPIIGGTIVTLLDKLIVLFCGGMIFKILHREAERYRKYLESLTS